ncbi:histidinol-phosphatase [Cohaesibacter celericrescens]|uniref:Histidinol-phosphatase n=1 Tax=Cohaesibacter celericrescens TaxID=2067669 RepID=A0A2N5XWZ2_9HYPH|nr:histidinol-phosphatase [Cohaesibacter celericrescens]PLW79020.1 histidinol-phosphatase [Cohaesibacter celericrescens]
MSHFVDEPNFAFLHELADLAGDIVMPMFRMPIAIENKESVGFDPVTDADKDAERHMRKAILARYPDDGILGEEFDAENLEAEGLWVLDPIDGTRAFISGLPTWGTLIGYRHLSGTQLGMMSQPFTGERYFGNGTNSFYKGPDGERSISTRKCPELSGATLFTTAPDIFNAEELLAFQRVEQSVRLSRYGVDCYAYCMVALGMADLVIEASLKPVDIAPLIPIIEGAGGIVTNWQGQSAFDGGQVVASGDADLHEKALALLGAKA